MSRAQTVELEAVSPCGQQAARQCHGEGIKLALSQTLRAHERSAAPVYHLQRIIGERRPVGYVQYQGEDIRADRRRHSCGAISAAVSLLFEVGDRHVDLRL